MRRKSALLVTRSLEKILSTYNVFTVTQMADGKVLF